MNAEHDHDDLIGARIRALRSWQPVAVAAGTWPRVEQRHRRRVTQRLIAGAVVVAIAFGAFGVAAYSSSASGKHLSVIPPDRSYPAALARALPPAPVGALEIAPPGPYRAGQAVRVSYQPPPAPTASDALNPGLAVCFPWDGGETCDPTITSHLIGTDADKIATYELTVPGWVVTPAGLQSCASLSCRFEIERADGTRVGTGPVDIAAGPKPHELARLSEVDREAGSVGISIDGMEPDASWTRWAASEDAAMVAKLPAGNITICAFAARLVCDGLVRPDPPPFDGHAHTITVPTNRLLLTTGGWVDCVKVVCVIAITRVVGVESVRPGQNGPLTSPGSINRVLGRDAGGNFTKSELETVAVVPYQLPPTTPEMARSTITYTPAGPFYISDTVTVTLHDPPPNVDPDTELMLSRCSGVDVEAPADCSQPDHQDWTKQPDGSLQQRVSLDEADPTNGIYFAIIAPTTFLPSFPLVARFPYIARTEPFKVTLSPAEQQRVDANLKRLHAKTAP